MAPRLAVLLSGSGSTFKNLAEWIKRGELDAEIVAVLSSRKDAFGLERARLRQIPALVCERREYAATEAYSDAVFEMLAPYEPDLVVLAGFMVRLKIPEAYAQRVVNVHPALIPAFCGKGWYGERVHASVLKRGCKVTGCTVHFCDNQYDHGPIILQKAVKVAEDDTPESLAARVQAAEREIYPQAIQLILEGRVKVEERRTIILPGASS